MEYFDIEVKLKTYLNQKKIRLCDEPYTINDAKGYGLKKLVELLANELNQSENVIEQALEDLRIKAISNVKCISKYNEKHICSIKVYEPKNQTNIILEIENIETETGNMFRMKVCQMLHANENMLKMIFNGKLIKDNDLLGKIGIKNNSKVMVLNMTESDSLTQEVLLSLNNGREMAEYLSKRAIDGKFQSNFIDLEITNQSGQVLQLTDNQKSSITYGLTMHKQATNFILNGNYQIALLHCLEADEAFTASKYCDQVDNVAILQLDIVWCYFCLQNVNEITESKRRLEICEQRMVKCYGEDNERIQKIREKTTFEGVPEAVHIFRLYLMKGILAYYENDNDGSTLHLRKALDLYNSLSVSDELITEVMQLGFSKEQAVDALRVNKNVNIAVEYIIRRSEDLKVLETQNQETKRKNKIVKRLGLTRDESRIDLGVLERLISDSHMSSSLCLAAIRRSNNHYANALELVFNNEEELRKDIEVERFRGNVHDGDISYDAVIKEKNAIEHIMQIVKLDKKTIKRSLRQSDGNIDQALNLLFDAAFNLPDSSPSSRSSSSVDNDATSSKMQLEENIYRTLGAGSSQDLESHYSNPDLFNEITAYNKFASLLNMPTILTINQGVQWN